MRHSWPLCVARLVREKTFSEAPQRYAEDYTFCSESEAEEPTQFYPTLKKVKHPKKYKVAGNIDNDLCLKIFNNANDFVYGIFSVGCGCKLMITYGFELMLNRESAHNLFRLLECRDIDQNALKTVIFYFACGLHPFVLHREA